MRIKKCNANEKKENKNERNTAGGVNSNQGCVQNKIKWKESNWAQKSCMGEHMGLGLRLGPVRFKPGPIPGEPNRFRGIYIGCDWFSIHFLKNSLSTLESDLAVVGRQGRRRLRQ